MTAAERLGRARDLYRRTATSRTAVVLLVANAIPLMGVLFLGWSLLTILVLYWLENGIIGFWNVPKIVLAQGGLRGVPGAVSGPPDPAVLAGISEPGQRAATPGTSAMAAAFAGVGRTAAAIFFLVHYGMFWVGHGIFVFLLPTFAGDDTGSCVPASDTPALVSDLFGGPACASGTFGAVAWDAIAVAGLALFLSHGASFLFNYIGRGEYLTATTNGQMGAPYVRVVVLHLTIIFGSFVIALLGAPIGALLVLVVLKTLFDLGLHLREHRAGVAVADGVA